MRLRAESGVGFGERHGITSALPIVRPDRSALGVLVVAAARTAREQGARAVLNFAAKSLRGPKELARWIEFIEGHHQQLGSPLPDPRVLRKPLRNYGRFGLRVHDRVEALIAHYKFAASHLPAGMHRKIVRGERVRIGCVEARDATFELKLSSSLAFGQRQEGELTLLFSDETGQIYSRIAFAFGRDPDGSPTLLIGGLQGLEPGADKKIIVRATRKLSGLRPKDAALVAVQALARALGIDRIYAVANTNHVLAGEWLLSDSVIDRDYDKFWIERGGQSRNVGGYQLPIPDYQARLTQTATPRLIDRFRASITNQVSAHLALHG